MHDVLSMMLPAQNTGVMLQQSIELGTLLPDLVLMTCEVIVTIYLLRPGRLDEIRETWKAKWSED